MIIVIQTTSLIYLVTATRSNTDTFWRKHCAAVPLVKTQENVTVNNSGKPVCNNHCPQRYSNCES